MASTLGSTKENDFVKYTFLMILRNPLFALATLLVCAIPPARADHAVLLDGQALFNVSIDDNTTTWARPLRVRYKSASFKYNYTKNTVEPLLGHSYYYYIGDFVKTSKELDDKLQMRKFMKERNWNNYQPPPPVVVSAFTPAPRVDPEPQVDHVEPETTQAQPTLADPLLPIGERIVQQLDLFITEQKVMVDQVKSAIKLGSINAETGEKYKIRLLETQLQTLQKYFPQDDILVKNAMEALQDQIKVVEKQGAFSFEQ